MSVSTLNIKSERQLQIVLMASTGLTDKEIAAQTGLAVGTLRTYWDRLRHRYQCRNRAEIIATVLQHQALEKFTCSLLNNLPMFVWKVGSEGRVQYRNYWFEKHSAQISGVDQSIEPLMCEGEREHFTTQWQRSRLLEHPFEGQANLMLGSANSSLHKIYLSPIRDQSSNLVFWLGYGREASTDPDSQMLTFLSGLVM